MTSALMSDSDSLLSSGLLFEGKSGVREDFMSWGLNAELGNIYSDLQPMSKPMSNDT